MTEQAPEQTPQGSKEKLVPEYQLIAMKNKLEEEINGLKTKIAEITIDADTKYQQYLSEQAAKDKLSAENEELAKSLPLLAAEKVAREKAEKDLTDLQSQYLSVVRSQLASQYGIPPERLKDKTLTELKTLEEALKLVGVRKASGFDTGGGAVSSSPLSTHEKLKKGMAEFSK